MSSPRPIHTGRHVLLFFMDGVGMGDPDPVINPFVTANLPNLNGLFGPDWFLAGGGPLSNDRASLVPTDPNLGVDGRPQSATGQAVILSGRNVPELIGEHYGPKPNRAVREHLDAGTLFSLVMAGGGTAALLSPYPQGYFDAIDSGRRLYSSVPYAAVQAGLSLMTAEDLRHGRAVSPDFTGDGWRRFLGYDDIPLRTPYAAGRLLAEIAPRYTFSFFEHWPSDRAGHRGTLAAARAHLEKIDQALGGLLEGWQDSTGLLIITSDHGNIEDKSTRLHTTNPVPTILVGPGHAELAGRIRDLTDITPVVQQFLGLEEGTESPV